MQLREHAWTLMVQALRENNEELRTQAESEFASANRVLESLPKN